MKYQWVWNRFYGGISQDDYIVPEAWYSLSVWCDTKTTPRFAKPNKWVTEFTSSPLNINAFHNISTWPYVIGGTIYSTVHYWYPNSTTATLLGSISWSADPTGKEVTGICSGIEWWVEYVYIFSTSRIHRTTTPLWAGISLDYKTFSTWSISYETHPINVNNVIYFHNKNVLYAFSLSASSVTAVLTFNNTEEKIIWFSNYNDQFRIYTTSPAWSWLYIWGGTSTQPEYKIPMPGIQLYWMVNVGNIDYVYTRKALYAVSGTQYSLVFKSTIYAEKFTTVQYNWCHNNGIVYIPWAFGVYTFKNELAWLPDSLSLDFQGATWAIHICDDPTNTALYQVSTSGGKLRMISLSWANWYYQWFDNVALSPGTPVTTKPYIISMIYAWDDTWLWLSNQKSISEINIWYKTPAGTSIDLYMRENTDSSWQLVKNISDLNWFMRIYPDELPFRDFVSLQYKIVLNAIEYSYPTFSDIKTIYEPIWL